MPDSTASFKKISIPKRLTMPLSELEVYYREQRRYWIKCEAKDLCRNECEPHDSITRFFYGVPCKTRKEARLLGDYLFPNSNHNLFSITFSTQSDLMVAWEIVGKLEIAVSFKDIYGNERTESKRLKVDYDSFWDAISIGTEQDKEEKEVLRKEVEKKSGYRTLASFERAEN